MSDILLVQTPDDGDVIIEGGVVELTDALESAVYLSLFGGNWQDDGSVDSQLQWWGNADVTDPQHAQRSRTQYLLQSMPLTSGSLKRVEDAALVDLEWLSESYAVTVSASIPAVNRVQFTIQVDDATMTITEDWAR